MLVEMRQLVGAGRTCAMAVMALAVVVSGGCAAKTTAASPAPPPPPPSSRPSADPATPSVASRPPASTSPAGTITEQSIRAHLEFLASDALNGRGSGTRDEWLAATYIASQFRLWGLEPMGDAGGYVQTIELAAAQATAAPVLAVGASKLTHGKEILFAKGGLRAPRRCRRCHHGL
jgi:hypothetical protein